ALSHGFGIHLGIILNSQIGGAAMTLSKKAIFVCSLAWAGLLVTCGIKAGIAQTTAARFVASDHAAAKDFAGTWNWMFKDKRFATMILSVQGNHLEGTVTIEWMNMNQQGRI